MSDSVSGVLTEYNLAISVDSMSIYTLVCAVILAVKAIQVSARVLTQSPTH